MRSQVSVHIMAREIPPGREDCSTDGCLRDAEVDVAAVPSFRRISGPWCWDHFVERFEGEE